EAFLAHWQRVRKHDVYRKYRIFLSSFCRRWGKVPAGELKRKHITKWLEEQETWSPTTKDEAGGAVKTCFAWGAEEGSVSKDPFTAFHRVAGRRKRSRLLTEPEWKALLSKARGEMKLILRLLRLTGARPGEVRKLTADMLDAEHSCCHLSPEEHKTGEKT